MRPTLKGGILTVTLDHSKLLSNDAFAIAKRVKYEQCISRDLCWFDSTTNQCRSCLTSPSSGCLRQGDFLGRDVRSMNRVNNSKVNPLDSVCEDWATMVSGHVTVGGDSITSADCPNDGCLGFAFRLPKLFQGQFYQSLDDRLKLSRCFLESAWMNDKLVQRRDGATALDPQCGAPQMLAPENEFCTDPTLELRAMSGGGVVTAALAASDRASAPTVVAFDETAIESFIAGGGSAEPRSRRPSGTRTAARGSSERTRCRTTATMHPPRPRRRSWVRREPWRPGT